MGIFSHPTPFNGQVYSDLRKEAQEKGELFVDKEFPPEEKSLFKSVARLLELNGKDQRLVCFVIRNVMK